MSSRLVVLWSCGARPEPGRACSGFVLEHDGSRAEAAAVFGGEVLVADEGLEAPLSPAHR
jgi:hypothetical protein